LTEFTKIWDNFCVELAAFLSNEFFLKRLQVEIRKDDVIGTTFKLKYFREIESFKI